MSVTVNDLLENDELGLGPLLNSGSFFGRLASVQTPAEETW